MFDGDTALFNCSLWFNCDLGLGREISLFCYRIYVIVVFRFSVSASRLFFFVSCVGCFVWFRLVSAYPVPPIAISP